MSTLKDDLDLLEEALMQLKNAQFRPRMWERIIAAAGVQIDRPGASLLHILAQCEKAKTACNVQLLAQHLGIEAPSVSRKIRELEDAGLLTRKADPKDRRTVLLHLTSKGRAMLERIHKAKQQDMADLLQGWSASDRHQFVRLFHRLASDMNRDQQPPK